MRTAAQADADPLMKRQWGVEREPGKFHNFGSNYRQARDRAERDGLRLVTRTITEWTTERG